MKNILKTSIDPVVLRHWFSYLSFVTIRLFPFEYKPETLVYVATLYVPMFEPTK